ncbi:Hypothetical predicted protein [Octopus vulgaris]|uniref:Uncharacterized protein n=1 Tax=Octopus vulgaris TaxID=6645 RepID=A0AA36BVU5_OCTVU|nr:Hypothetical predicted protein [Octopus vulgaris]
MRITLLRLVEDVTFDKVVPSDVVEIAVSRSLELMQGLSKTNTKTTFSILFPCVITFSSVVFCSDIPNIHNHSSPFSYHISASHIHINFLTPKSSYNLVIAL